MPESLLLEVVLADDLLALNRVVSLARRHQVMADALQAGPAAEPGYLRVTWALRAEPAALERLANQLLKVAGVRSAEIASGDEADAREALVARVQCEQGRLAELYALLELYGARVTDERTGAVTVEAMASPPRITALVRALEAIGPCRATRSGPLLTPREPTAADPPARPAVTSFRATPIPA